jgi:ATP-dependent Clp protease ATP-binding subunit ClpC
LRKEESVQYREAQFTDAARQVLALARDEADRLHHEYIGTEHLVLALTRQTQGVVATALRTLCIDVDGVRATIENIVQRGAVAPARGIALPYTSRTKQVFDLARESAQALGEQEIDTEHLLVGVLREAKSVGGQILLHHGLSEAVFLKKITRIKSGDDAIET